MGAESMDDAQVLIAGGGLTGCITACLLHDRGVKVLIVDRLGEVMQGASRWNEGKIHLGYTYVGTGSVRTAELMLAGAATFQPLVERVTGMRLDDDMFTRPIVYLVDVNSVFPSDILWQRTQAVHALVEEAAVRYPWIAAGHPSDTALRRLDPYVAAEATQQTNVVAAWSTPERAICTRVLADRVAAAVRARDIPTIRGEIDSIEDMAGHWKISLAHEASVRGRVIVNALWEDRSRIDRRFSQKGPVSIRWKAAVFARGQRQFGDLTPSTRILGGYGDITPYGNGDVYLSWYPSNMIARSDDGSAPTIPDFDRTEMMRRTLEGLCLPPEILGETDPQACVRGGYVVARGSGDIYETTSPLHDRSAAFAVELAPGLVSVDSGKLTTAPLFAERAARLVLGRLGKEAAA